MRYANCRTLNLGHIATSLASLLRVVSADEDGLFGTLSGAVCAETDDTACAHVGYQHIREDEPANFNETKYATYQTFIDGFEHELRDSDSLASCWMATDATRLTGRSIRSIKRGELKPSDHRDRGIPRSNVATQALWAWKNP